MPEPKAYSYAVLRVVPRVDRDEFMNAGVILFSQELRYLGARVHLDEGRLSALAPGVDAAAIRRHLEAVPRVCVGDAGAGPIARLPMKDRFHWLTAPRSTMIQVSPIRTGITAEPERALEALIEDLVR
ncbi:MAG TPA: DUF3037 domain-containing protein [Acidobacteriaceae bacterium]|nr:DUF3037 domain-containing protein [Acidobacteriaceae bacterium]